MDGNMWFQRRLRAAAQADCTKPHWLEHEDNMLSAQADVHDAQDAAPEGVQFDEIGL